MNEDFEQVMGDTMFVASLVADLIKVPASLIAFRLLTFDCYSIDPQGMIYLHDSNVGSHGNLKSSNCLVDSRWVLQISDYGLPEFKAGQEESEATVTKKMRSLLWRSPELLRQSNPASMGTQKGDVYSFAIILYEIIGRKGPWGEQEKSIDEIVDCVMHPEIYGGQIFRPDLKHVDYKNHGHYVIKCIEDCWHERPECRPDFRYVNIRLKELQAGLYVTAVLMASLSCLIFCDTWYSICHIEATSNLLLSSLGETLMLSRY